MSESTDWASDAQSAITMSSDGFASMEPVKLNIRRRFWRWMLGYDQPLFTLEQMQRNQRMAVESMIKNPEESLFGSKRFQIIEATNGKIIRYTPGMQETENANAVPNRIQDRAMRIANDDRYYLVKEGENLLGAIATIMALKRVE